MQGAHRDPETGASETVPGLAQRTGRKYKGGRMSRRLAVASIHSLTPRSHRTGDACGGGRSHWDLKGERKARVHVRPRATGLVSAPSPAALPSSPPSLTLTCPFPLILLSPPASLSSSGGKKNPDAGNEDADAGRLWCVWVCGGAQRAVGWFGLERKAWEPSAACVCVCASLSSLARSLARALSLSRLALVCCRRPLFPAEQVWA